VCDGSTNIEITAESYLGSFVEHSLCLHPLALLCIAMTGSQICLTNTKVL
jgi:hypothetical protein